MTDYPEYTLTRPPNCPAKWDHINERLGYLNSSPCVISVLGKIDSHKGETSYVD